MTAPPSRARADYDYLIKLLLIGDKDMCFFVVLDTRSEFEAMVIATLFIHRDGEVARETEI